ncbi:hypothetical protein CIL05_07435 [Virgibacillus profundi]|uniref:Uncharacterized protein n=1 Tax=Virgibacillus profundi TaxID=2024555 RepID=A0A2A2IGS9_9BACI|nr:hypothetical protein [Virgibacillus profundi]PAV30293.1 hypothetical protein CIL05_07435 [Virgibacillus profundi]PXY54465.1 hypothetical protein CIT14_07520 [Virgibacillus profundi]
MDVEWKMNGEIVIKLREDDLLDEDKRQKIAEFISEQLGFQVCDVKQTVERRINMGDWLTTGQMIDKLKVGERADSVKKFTGYNVTKTNRGIVFGDGEPLFMNSVALDIKWKITPVYVTFEEAMKALKEGKEKVFFHDGEWKAHVVYDEWIENSYVSGYTFEQLLTGNWTVED